MKCQYHKQKLDIFQEEKKKEKKEYFEIIVKLYFYHSILLQVDQEKRVCV